MRKKLTIAAVLVIMLALIAAGTWAYFTADGETTNYITTGTVSMALSEMKLDADGKTEITYVNPVNNVMPGNQVSKIVRVENSGTADFWTRVKVDIVVTGADGKPLDSGVVVPDIDTGDWSIKDGWYYYKKSVAPGDKTEPLFNAVEFAKTMGNAYQGCSVTIAITAQAVQCANNTAVDVLGVSGWPNT